MVTFPEKVGIIVLTHELAPPVPEIAKVTTPVGATAFVAPVTVAVNVIAPPSVSVAGDSVMAIVGTAAETKVPVGDVTVATEKNAVSPGKVNEAL